MQPQASAIRAAIDIGSNTIEVLVARCLPGDLEIIEHQTTMVRLGESVDDSGEISRDKFDTAVDTVHKYQELAKKHEAKQIFAVATEALREAHNSQDFLEAVKRETGIEVQLISGSAEAVLDYYGATYGPGTPSENGLMIFASRKIARRCTRCEWLPAACVLRSMPSSRAPMPKC